MPAEISQEGLTMREKALHMGQRFIFGDQTNKNMITLPSQAKRHETMSAHGVKPFVPTNQGNRLAQDSQRVVDEPPLQLQPPAYAPT